MTRCLKSGRRVLTTLALGFVVSGMPQAQAQVIDPANVAFGYTDSAGSMLLALDSQDELVSAALATSLVEAVCMEGVFRINFVVMQQPSVGNNFRDTAGNFAHARGALFEIVGGGARPSDACLLLPEGYRDEYSLVVPLSGGSAPAADTIARVAAAYDRPVEQYHVLQRQSDSAEVAAVYFGPDGDQLLGAIVLVTAAALFTYDMPATRDEYSCWSVDDGCEFRAERMHVPAVFRSAGGDMLVYCTFDGYESQTLTLFQARAGQLVALRRSGRYWAPL